MKTLIAAALIAELTLFGAQASADESKQNPVSKEQRMADCMSRMTAKQDGSTKDQMRVACNAEVQKEISKTSPHDDWATNR